jgi:phosphatidyl-myo-inositol dimannoside synthase
MRDRFLGRRRAEITAPCGGTSRDFIALIPSSGLGGGIEAYTSAVLDVLIKEGATVDVWAGSRLGGQKRSRRLWQLEFAISVLWRSVRWLRFGDRREVTIVAFHPGLLPIAVLVRMVIGTRCRRVVAVFYGVDILRSGIIRRKLWRLSRAECITISDFSAGALGVAGRVKVLPPALTPERYRLFSASFTQKKEHDDFRIVSVFRLNDVVKKGGLELASAVEAMRETGRNVTLAIAGTPADELHPDLMERGAWMTVVQGPSDQDLASLYAEADLFVLATRVRAGKGASGEGFGIVLVEAALAGLPVVAPAAGGSHAAFLDGITGLRPRDEGEASLRAVLEWCFSHRERLRDLGRNGREWALEAFHPERYRERVRQTVMECTASASPTPLELTIERAGNATGRSEDYPAGSLR